MILLKIYSIIYLNYIINNRRKMKLLLINHKDNLLNSYFNLLYLVAKEQSKNSIPIQFKKKIKICLIIINVIYSFLPQVMVSPPWIEASIS